MSWVTWILQIFFIGSITVKSFDLLFHPALVWQIIGRIREVGTWGTSGSEATHGTELTVIWSLEAWASFPGNRNRDRHCRSTQEAILPEL